MKRTVLLLAMITCLAGVAAADTPDLQIAKQVVEPQPLQIGQYANIWFTVENNGTADAEDVVIEFEENYPFSVRPDADDEWRFRSIEEGEKYTFRLQMQVDRSAIAGEEELTFWTGHGTGDGRSSQSIPVTLRDDDTALVIDSVDRPDRVAPGSTAVMNITISNLANTHFQNIDVSLDLSGEMPVAVGDTTRKRIQTLDGGDSATLSYPVMVDENADAGVHRIPVTLAYENIAGTGFTKQQQTGLVIGGESDVQVSLERTDLHRAGARGDVTVRVVNQGVGQARFVDLSIPDEDGFEVLSTDSVYVGNMIPDDYQTAEFDLYVAEDAAGLTLPVKVSYTDAQGQTVEEVQQVQVPTYDDEHLQRYGLVDQSRGMLYGLLIAALLVIGGAVYWKRRRA